MINDLNENFPHDPPNSIQEFLNGNERLSIEKNKTLFAHYPKLYFKIEQIYYQSKNE
jgi:hypothetical protein